MVSLELRLCVCASLILRLCVEENLRTVCGPSFRFCPALSRLSHYPALVFLLPLVSAVRSTSTSTSSISLVSCLCIEEYFSKYLRKNSHSLWAVVMVLAGIEQAVSLVFGPCIGVSRLCIEAVSTPQFAGPLLSLVPVLRSTSAVCRPSLVSCLCVEEYLRSLLVFVLVLA